MEHEATCKGQGHQEFLKSSNHVMCSNSTTRWSSQPVVKVQNLIGQDPERFRVRLKSVKLNFLDRRRGIKLDTCPCLVFSSLAGQFIADHHFISIQHSPCDP